jgi:SM-20-related protein
MLNPDLDPDALAKEYAKDNRLRIEGFLSADIAERLRAACRDHVPYEFLCNVDGQNIKISASQMQEMDPKRRQDLIGKIISDAANGVGFFYGGYKMQRSMPDAENDQLAIVREVYDYLNSAEVFSLIERVTGHASLTYADAQYTSYTFGHFLTRHNDDISQERRRVAYVLGLSKNWHPDWGGLLHFFENDGAPRDFWVPSFNSLSLFDVRHIHSVSYVTPFAKEPRLSLTGWFCD